MKKPKVAVIGLDGATWELLSPWIKENKLPFFKKILKRGVWGELASTIPPITFPAWHSLFTGLNPGKIGVYNFVEVNIENRKYEINTIYSFKGKTLWEILSKYGYKSCVIGVPTAKARKINGVIIGGPFSGSKNIYPVKYIKFLKKINYQSYPQELIKSVLHTGVKPSLKLIKEVISSRFKLAKYLIEKESPDFLALVIFITDNLQHFFWDEDILYETWKYIDKELDIFLSKYLDESIVFIVSDHGLTMAKKTFFLSKFLEKLGLIKFKRPLRYIILSKISVDKIINFSRKIKIRKIIKIFGMERIEKLLSMFQDKSGRLGAKGLELIIDWEKSKAIPIDTLIYLNCDEEHKDGLKKYIKHELEKLNIIDKVYCRTEIYQGKYVNKAPDLIIIPKKGIDVLENPYAENMIINKVVRSGWKAIHTPHGIFIAIGPGIARNKKISPVIYDIVPTILSIFNIPTTNLNLDGRCLHEIFKN